MILSDGINHGKLQSIIVGELKKVGLKHRLKKIILKSVKDNKTLFGAPLFKVPSCSVICCGSTLSIPMVVSEMSSVLRTNAHIEGLFRKAGSQTRQKDIKRLLDAGGCVSEGHHPIDVASVFKLYLRSLPEPLISAEVQDLLLRCRLSAGNNALKSILNTLLLLPVLHVHLLHYIMELLNFIASRHKDNLMDSSNLAIVLAPSIMPLPAAASAQRLEHHVALVKIFIENSQHIGILTKELMSQLDDDSDVHHAKRKKRRSGSLNRVLNGLRKMVSSSVHTPATVREGKTPILSKSAAKRKFDSQEGLSAKTKKDIKKCLPNKELSFTPMKLGLERKRLRLSLVDARSTPVINVTDFSSHKNSETSISSEDMLTSSEHLFSAHDTIDLSPDMKKHNKDYVRIPKQEYEEIKSRVSAIENRLSREFTDVPRVEPLQHVQNAYEQTLEDVAMLNCPNSDNLARRLSRELKIRPSEQAKIFRSPSARKIGNIRRRSKENVKIVRHKSWNASSQSSHNVDRFYPYMGLTRERTNTANSDLMVPKKRVSKAKDWEGSTSDNSTSVSSISQKYYLRKRSSVGAECNLNKTISRPRSRRSLNTSNNNSYEGTASDNSTLNNTTLNSSGKSNNSANKLNDYQNVSSRSMNRRSPSQQKWRSAAAFFMDKTGEVENNCLSGRPSVNKLRRQNAGAVLAKAKLFESSSDRSSERNDQIVHTGFARRPRVSSQNALKTHRMAASTMARSEEVESSLPSKQNRNTPPAIPLRTNRLNMNYHKKEESDSWRPRKASPPIKRVVSPQANAMRTPLTPALKKSLCPQRNLRTPVGSDIRRINTPMKAVHVSPRRSPRQKTQRYLP